MLLTDCHWLWMLLQCVVVDNGRHHIILCLLCLTSLTFPVTVVYKHSQNRWGVSSYPTCHCSDKRNLTLLSLPAVLLDPSLSRPSSKVRTTNMLNHSGNDLNRAAYSLCDSTWCSAAWLRHTHLSPCVYIQYQSKVWTHLLTPGLFFIFTTFYIVE